MFSTTRKLAPIVLARRLTPIVLARKLACAVLAVAIVGCGNCDSKCTEGISFFVAEVAGALSRGGKETLTICFDGTCKEVTITREQVGGSVFLPFKGVGKDIDHDLTVAGTGSLRGEFKGKFPSYTQDPGGDCSSCDLATVKIGADGKLTPATAATQVTTTPTG